MQKENFKVERIDFKEKGNSRDQQFDLVAFKRDRSEVCLHFYGTYRPSFNNYKFLVQSMLTVLKKQNVGIYVRNLKRNCR